MPNDANATASPAEPAGHRGTRAIQRLVEYAPATGGLALWVHHRDLEAGLGDTPAAPWLKGAPAPLVATDGHTVLYAPGFEALPLPEQAGLVAHEVLHIALRHPARALALAQTLGEIDLVLFNACADAIVNSTLSHLGWLRLPPHALMLEDLLRQALQVDVPLVQALLEWDVERLYRAVDDRRRGDSGRGRAAPDTRRAGGSGGPPAPQPPEAEARQPAAREDGPRAARTRALMDPRLLDLLPAARAPRDPEAEAEQAREWSERLQRAHAGDGAHSMLRALIADLPRPRTPWEQILRTQLARHLSVQPALNWSRPSRSYLANQGRAGPGRRMPFEPGVSPGKAVPRLVLVVDVSGSIDSPLLQRFAAEVESLVRRLHSRAVLVIGDERVQAVSHFEPGRMRLGDVAFRGGGGTDFTPLLREAEAHAPDLIVVLTDLDGPARHRPRAPVLWAVPDTHAAAVAPFGRVLCLR